MNINKYEIILSSGSPRRKELLGTTNLNFSVQVKSIDETINAKTPVDQIALLLAIQKGEAWNNEIKQGQLIITADTIVVHKKNVLGKPINDKQAFKMLKSLSDTTHEVHTGVALTTTSKKSAFMVKSLVTFAKLSDQMINEYIATGSPADKAGAYGIQDDFGLRVVQKIEGSYSNIIGLPVAQLIEHLEKF